MSLYRVDLSRPDSNDTFWEYSDTIPATSAEEAVRGAWERWRQRDADVPPLSVCRKDVRSAGQTRMLADAGISNAQQAFAENLKSKVDQFLGSRLDGEFHTVSHPAGFHYGITYGPNAYWNKATLQDIDSLLQHNENGQLELTSSRFHTLFHEMMSAVRYQFSTEDEQTIAREDENAEAQISAVLTAYENAGGTYPDPLPLGGKIQAVLDYVTQNYGSWQNLPDGLHQLRSAIATYRDHARASLQLKNRRAEANARRDAAKAHAGKPSAENGGQEVASGEYYVGYQPSNLPSANQLLQDLKNESNKITMQMVLSNFSSNSVNVSIDGSAGLSVPIKKIVRIGFGGEVSYDMSRYTSSSSKVVVDMEFPGVTFFASRPSPLTANNEEGWFANDILRQVAEKTGEDKTGYRFLGGEFDPDELFGPGKHFARLKTFVISQEPKMTFKFQASQEERLKHDFHTGLNASIDLAGLFRLGSISADFGVKDVKSESSEGMVEVTFGPPEPQGTIPLEKKRAYVLGGVPSYPPDDR